MQNVTEYYASSDPELFITVAYLLSFFLLSWVFFASFRALQAKKRTLERLKSSE